MKYGSGKGRFEAAGGSGMIFTGKVVADPKKRRLVLVDEAGDAYDVQDDLKALVGQEVRLTLISVESISRISQILEAGPGSSGSLPEGHTPVTGGHPRIRRA